MLIAGQCTPHFLFGLAEKKTGRGRSKRKERFAQNLHVRAGLLTYGGLPNRCRQNRAVFCRLAPDYSLARVLRRDCRIGADFGVVVERPVFLNSLALCLVVDGGFVFGCGQTGVHPVEPFAEEHGS